MQHCQSKPTCCQLKLAFNHFLNFGKTLISSEISTHIGLILLEQYYNVPYAQTVSLYKHMLDIL